ncbi:MAG: hypothetical protein ACTSW3_07205 [Promethearchaeota archaeon]
MKKQEIVLYDIKLSGKITIKKIAKNTNLKYSQIHRALRDLLNRRLIIKTKEGITPYFEVNEKVISRIKTILNRAKENDKLERDNQQTS